MCRSSRETRASPHLRGSPPSSWQQPVGVTTCAAFLHTPWRTAAFQVPACAVWVSSCAPGRDPQLGSPDIEPRLHTLELRATSSTGSAPSGGPSPGETHLGKGPARSPLAPAGSISFSSPGTSSGGYPPDQITPLRSPVETSPVLVVTAAVVAGAWPTAAFAATQPRLGTALNFAAITGSTITNTGPTVIKGNVALSPGSAVTGFPPGISAVRNIADANAVKAKTDLVTAFTDAASAPSTSNLTGKNLGGLNLTAGVYSFSSSAQLTGKLTLSGTGVFIFRIGSALTTATASAVLLRNGAQACAVYWEVGSSATLGSATQFQGNLM